MIKSKLGKLREPEYRFPPHIERNKIDVGLLLLHMENARYANPAVNTPMRPRNSTV